MMDALIFYVFAGLALAGGLGVVLNVRNTVSSALCLLLSMLALAVLFVQLNAEFIGVLQVMVYAGAIVVLFLFVIMLLNLRGGSFAGETRTLAKWLGVGLIAVSALKMSAILRGGRQIFGSPPDGFGGVRALAQVLYTDYLIAVEVAGVLLLAGIVGALILAKREID